MYSTTWPQSKAPDGEGTLDSSDLTLSSLDLVAATAPPSRHCMCCMCASLSPAQSQLSGLCLGCFAEHLLVLYLTYTGSWHVVNKLPTQKPGDSHPFPSCPLPSSHFVPSFHAIVQRSHPCFGYPLSSGNVDGRLTSITCQVVRSHAVLLLETMAM
ncbi:hypothetical protein CGRA01v4_05313 [Colletotrichum graminicola]|nr:hypothetical protein CGRA01v4_05313 [Colletotrichum graminicola]